jgi:hypothetical protein
MRIWTTNEIKSIILVNDDQLKKALVKLYAFQTQSEQTSQNTLYFNNVGFNGADGKFLSNVAEFYNRNGYLSPKQIKCVRKRLLKYSGQLAKIVNGKQLSVSEPKRRF